MNEHPNPTQPEGDYTEEGVPTFDYVRDQIENRHATATGANELAEESAAGQSVEQQLAEREKAGRDRLAEIRRSLREGS